MHEHMWHAEGTLAGSVWGVSWGALSGAYVLQNTEDHGNTCRKRRAVFMLLPPTGNADGYNISHRAPLHLIRALLTGTIWYVIVEHVMGKSGALLLLRAATRNCESNFFKNCMILYTFGRQDDVFIYKRVGMLQNYHNASSIRMWSALWAIPAKMFPLPWQFNFIPQNKNNLQVFYVLVGRSNSPPSPPRNNKDCIHLIGWSNIYM